MTGQILDGLTVAAADAAGGSVRLPLDFVRNSAGYLLSSSASGTVSPLPTVLTSNLILTAALTGGLSVPMPPGVPDGYILTIVNGTSAAFTGQTITVSDGNATFANGSTVASLAAGASAEWQFTASPPTWYRIR